MRTSRPTSWPPVLVPLLVAGLLAPAPAPAQTGEYRGMQGEVAFRTTSLTGGGFPHEEIGLGVQGAARYLWPSGFSLAMGGRYAQPEDLSLSGDDPRRTMEEVALYGEVRFEVQEFGRFRPYAGGRLGWTTLRSENVQNANGSGLLGGLVVGTEVRATDELAFRLNAVASAFRVPGFGDVTSGQAWSAEAGLSYFFGEVFESVAWSAGRDGGGE